MTSDTTFSDVEGVPSPSAADRGAQDSAHALTVARLFAEVFETEPIKLDDNFFQLGGDSLMATSLMTSVEHEFGVVLSISVLLEAPTPRLLAARVLEASADRVGGALTAVRAEGSGPPLLCVHGMNGESVFPQRLSDGLVDIRPVYAYRAIGLQAGERPLATVEAMASSYLAAIRRVRPSGPYLLLGNCGSSMIAYEMAQQLVAAGETVAGLILIDPAYDRSLAPFLFASGLSLSLVQSRAAKRSAEIQASIDADPDAFDEKRRDTVRGALYAAVAAYAPAPFDGKTLLIHTTERKQALLDSVRGFPTLLHDCEIVEIESFHKNLFKNNVADVAAAIAPFLDRVAPLR